MRAVRILLLADSHLGFDLPARPRVPRRRRGHDFLANYARALAPALQGEVDIVVHAGDVFDHPHASPVLAYQAFEPLRRVAERGIPVFLVPGNHERSRLPHLRFASHPNVHVFDRPRSFAVDAGGVRVALSGFPYERRNVRANFTALLDRTGWQRTACDARLLCIHHCVEGARVGPQNFTFTSSDDVIRINDVPDAFSAVLSGHIHRHQVLTADLRRRPVSVPVLYPGSIERTAFAELGEPKGYLVVELASGRETPWEFRSLPARPMITHEIMLEGMSGSQLQDAVRAVIEAAPIDAVIGIRCRGAWHPDYAAAVSASGLRAIAPDSMNIEVWISEAERSRTRTRTRTRNS